MAFFTFQNCMIKFYVQNFCFDISTCIVSNAQYAMSTMSDKQLYANTCSFCLLIAVLRHQKACQLQYFFLTK